MIRAFLAIELDPALRSALAVQQFLLPLPRKELVENLHLTLVFLGEQAERKLEEVHEAIGTLRLPALSLDLAGLGLFGGEKVRAVWAGVSPNPQLMRLQEKLETAVRRAGIETEHRRFVPHVTLGRFRPPGIEERMRIERAVASGSDFHAGPMPVGEIVMFESIRSAAGSRYEALARYPLG